MIEVNTLRGVFFYSTARRIHATVARRIGPLVVLAVATTMARIEIEIIPSFAPKTAALAQLLRCRHQPNFKNVRSIEI